MQRAYLFTEFVKLKHILYWECSLIYLVAKYCLLNLVVPVIEYLIESNTTMLHCLYKKCSSCFLNLLLIPKVNNSKLSCNCIIIITYIFIYCWDSVIVVTNEKIASIHMYFGIMFIHIWYFVLNWLVNLSTDSFHVFLLLDDEIFTKGGS